MRLDAELTESHIGAAVRKKKLRIATCRREMMYPSTRSLGSRESVEADSLISMEQGRELWSVALRMRVMMSCCNAASCRLHTEQCNSRSKIASYL